MIANPSPSRRAALRDAFIAALDRSGALEHARRRCARAGVVALTLHRVVSEGERDGVRSPRGMVLSEPLFRELVAYLASRALCLSMKQAANPHAPATLPRVLVTFDDGWCDNARVAWPALQRAGIPMSVFVTTALAGQASPFWVERLLGLLRGARASGSLPEFRHALQRWIETLAPARPVPVPSAEALAGDPECVLRCLKPLPALAIFAFVRKYEAACARRTPEDPSESLMDWPELQRLHSEGVHLGSHTATHAILTQISPLALHTELTQSKEALEVHGFNARTLAYPNGDADARVVRGARAAGYRYGFLNTPGLWTSATDPLMIPRVNVWDGTLTDRHGRFSRAHLEYALFRRALTRAAR